MTRTTSVKSILTHVLCRRAVQLSKSAYFIRSKITFVTCNKNLIQEGKYELFHSQPVRDVVSDFCLTVTVILALKGFSG